MHMRKKIGEYKPEIYALVVLVIAVLAELGALPLWLTTRVAIASVTLIVLLTAFLLEFRPGRVASKQKVTSETLTGLKKDLFLNRTRSVVIFRNAPLDDLFPLGELKDRLTSAIREKDCWDWSYIGPHPDCDGLCGEMVSEIEEVYLGEETIQTSSLTVLNDYPLRRDSMIFIGDLLTPSSCGDAKHFPDHIWDAVINGCELHFTKVYTIRTAWRADKTSCTVRQATVSGDPMMINQKWTKVYNMIREQATIKDTLVLREGPEDDNKVISFFKKVRNNVFTSCSSMFVISSDSGNLLRVKKGLGRIPRFAVFCIVAGWLLSPFSFYNDIYVNVPLSILLGRSYMLITGHDTVMAYGVAYLFTNILGVALILLGLKFGRKEKRWGPNSLLKIGFNLFIFAFVSIVIGGLFL